MKENKEKIINYFRELEFESGSHKYSHKGKYLNSVSSVIKNFTQSFDADKIAFLVARKRTREGRTILLYSCLTVKISLDIEYISIKFYTQIL